MGKVEEAMLGCEKGVERAGGHGTFASGEQQPKAQSSRHSQALIYAAGVAIAVVLVACAGLVPSAQPSALMDDVAHDSATAKTFGGSVAAKGGRGLNAHSSIADFFHAAMRGDFQKKSNVKLATDGLFQGKAHLNVGAISYQALAARRIRSKSVHTAHVGSKAVHKKLQERPHVVAKARVQQLPGGVVMHSRPVVHRVSERGWRFPSEDKFVARYTGGVPSGDVVVDSFTAGPYVPL